MMRSKKDLTDFSEFVHDGFRFAESVSPRMVLARSQVGKTAAAACVEVMTALYPMIDLLISTGISGALAPQDPHWQCHYWEESAGVWGGGECSIPTPSN